MPAAELYERELTDADFRRVGRMVKDRREELELTRERVKELGGPAVTSLLKIERGDPADYRPGTTRPLERILQWTPGSFRDALYLGVEPVALVTNDYDAVLEEALAASESHISKVSNEELVAELLRRLTPRGPLAGAVAAPTAQIQGTANDGPSSDPGATQDDLALATRRGTPRSLEQQRHDEDQEARRLRAEADRAHE